MKLVLKAPIEHELILVGNTVGAVALVFALCVLLGVAALSYRFIEEPARRIGRAWLDSVEPKAAARRELSGVSGS